MFNLCKAGLLYILFVLPLHVSSQNLGGNPASIKWRQINSSMTRVIFPAGLDSQASRISHMIGSLDSITLQSLGNKWRKWNVVLQNQTTIPNAYVRLAPVLSELYMTPAQDNFSLGSLRWDDNLIIHENRHMQQFSNFNNGLTKVFSFFLGQEGQLLANGLTIPDYFFEGDAVWQETLVSNQGRGRMPFFYNDFNSLWLANKKYSWMKLRSGSYKDLTPDHYLLGYLLVAYGNALYGEQFWQKVTKDATQFKGLFYPFNTAIKKYSGKSYRQFRADAIEYFKAGRFSVKDANADSLEYITPNEKNNVVDYSFPNYISDDSILVSKKSYKSASAFYLLINGKQTRIRIRNTGIVEYFSYSNGKIVYSSYQSDPRWTNRDFSVLQVIDLKTHCQKQISYKSKYFSPALNDDATEILAVKVNPDGTNQLHRLNAFSGKIILSLPNPQNYFFTQTKYLGTDSAVAAVRNPEGKMALLLVNLVTGANEAITPFSFNVLGYPFVKNGFVYFSAMDQFVDRVYAVELSTKRLFKVSENQNGIYQPVLNTRGEMLVTAVTASGGRLAKLHLGELHLVEVSAGNFAQEKNIYTREALKGRGAGALYKVSTDVLQGTAYKKSFQLFNFHSRRPLASDPEYGYSFFSDNVLSSFSNSLSYTYNRNEHSHTVGFSAIYAGWFPVLSVGTEASFNRDIDTALGRSVNFNSAKINAGISVPLNFTGGRTNKYFRIGAGYNIEQLYYRGIGKNIFSNEAFRYLNSFISFSNVSRQALQQVSPRWAQTIAMSYRHAFNLRESHKFVSSAGLYFPGLMPTHSILLQAAYQKRDTLADIFSNTFSYARGYQALSTRRMYKVGFNYQMPVLYPDLGIGNIIFFQRVRTNAFYDYCSFYVRLNGDLKETLNRSTGIEAYFDTKLWNALPFSFGLRYSRLLDKDIRNPGAFNRWEFILPIGFIPN